MAKVFSSQLGSDMGGYTTENEPEVLRFIREHPDLGSLLLELYSAVQRYFGQCEIHLKLTRFPDEPSIVQLLVSPTIAVDSVDEANALERFDDGWWIDNMDRFRGLVCVLPRYA